MKSLSVQLTGFLLLLLLVFPQGAYSADDFYFEHSSTFSSTVNAGSDALLQFRHCYSGDQSSSQLGNSLVYFYLSTNSTYGSSDEYLGSYETSIGNDQSCVTRAIHLTIPVITTPGTYYILSRADPTNLYSETNENNNVISSNSISVQPSTSDYLLASKSDVWLEQPSGSSGTFEINSNVSWSIDITNEAPWIDVSPTSGSGDATITLTADSENPNSWTRTAVLEISGSGVDDVTVYGNQDPVFEMELSAEDVWLDQASGSTATFEIISNTWWNITTEESWIDISPTEGNGDATITLTATSENPDSWTRTALISVTGHDVDNLTVYGNQHGDKGLEVSTSSLSLGSQAGSSATFGITSNTTWTITDDADWLTITPTSGSDDATITVSANTTNSGTSERSATISISGSGVETQTISLSQNAEPYLSVSPGTLSLGPAAGTNATINVSSNTSWNVTDNADWLTISPASGSGNGTITVTTNSANNGMDTRTATVSISASGLATQQVTVSQSAMGQLSVSPTSLILSSSSGANATLSLTSNVNWNITDDAEWLSVSPSSGSGNATITISTTFANPDLASRMATITVTGSGVDPVTVNVTQEGASSELSVSTTTILLGQAAGSEASFDVSSNIAWTVSKTEDWISLNPASGSGNGTVAVSAATANMEATKRSAILTLSGSGVPSKTVTVEQQGMLNPPVLIFQSIQINDGIEGLFGNGNGIVERNEYVDLLIILNNTGGVSATGVSATLSTVETGLTVVTSKSYFENVLPGNAQTCISAFRIYVAEDATPKDYNMSLDISCNEGSFTSSFMLSVAESSIVMDYDPDVLSIYPNPTDGNLTVKFSKPVKEGILTISDMSGRIQDVYELKDQSLEYHMNMGNLSSGPYLIHLKTKEYTRVFRIMVK